MWIGAGGRLICLMIRWCEEVWRDVSDAELLALLYKSTAEPARMTRRALRRHPDFAPVFKGMEHSAVVAEMAWRWVQAQPPLHTHDDDACFATQRMDDL